MANRDKHVAVLLTDDEQAMVRRVATRYGLSMSAAGRLLILTGAEQHDPNPSPPKEH